MQPIRIFDDQLNWLGELDAYQYLLYHRKWRKSDHFSMVMNKNLVGSSLLQIGNIISFTKDGKERTGRIEEKQIPLDDSGKISENMVVSGRSYTGIFQERLSLHNTTTGTGYDTQQGNAETVMKHYVNVNCINPSNVNRTVPRLQNGSNQNRGITVQTRARFQTVEEVLESLSIASGLGWSDSLDLGNGQFSFDVYEGRNLSPSQTTLPPVIFSPDFDNVKMLNFKESLLDSKNTIVVAGQGSGATRTIQTVFETEPSGLDRRELFVDARDLETTDELIQRGNERLNELKGEIVFEIENLPYNTFKYGVDFDLGDIVHVNYPDIASMDSRIIEVVEETTPQGESFKLVFGKEWGDLITFIKRNQRNLSVGVRV